MQELRPRLKTAAELVRGGKTVADIGTDHAYLPAWLLLNGVAPYVIACDVGELPLRNAAETVRIYHLTGRIELRLSDGLRSVSPEEYGEVTVCGMGGTLIAEILEKAALPEDVRLVLQPMTHVEDVRAWLCRRGFAIEREVCVKGATEEERFFLKKTRDRVKTRADALAAAGRCPEEQALLRQALDYYDTNYDNYRKRCL